MSVEQSPIHGDFPHIASATGAKDFKELSSAAFSRTRMPMVLADARQPDKPIVLANQAFLDLTGYQADEVIGRNCRFLQGSETSAEAIDKIRAALSMREGVDVELLNYRKDGSSFWNQLHLSPILDDDGNVAYYFASQIDVTEFRKVQGLEAAEHRLLMEVDHRTKNAMAIIESIVRLSNPTDPSAYAAAIQRRVHSLARAHELLSRNGWRPVDLNAILEAQLGEEQSRQITLKGPAISVDVEFVQPLSLVVLELHANARLHGSLSPNCEGRLGIEWEAVYPGGGFKLSWHESRVGPGAPGTKEGFGTVIATTLVEKQMAGTMSKTWDDSGLVIQIALPARKVLSGSRFG